MPVASGGSWRRQAATIDSKPPATSHSNLVAVELCRHLGRWIFFTIMSALIPKQENFRICYKPTSSVSSSSPLVLQLCQSLLSTTVAH